MSHCGEDLCQPTKVMMKVCFFIPSLGDGGAQRQCIALLNQLQLREDVELHLILLGAGIHDDSLATSRIEVHRIQVRNFASPFAFAFVVRTLRQVRPDVLISWLHPADIWAYAATRLVRSVPWIITERGSVYPNTVVFNLRKRLGRRAALVIPNSVAGEKVWQALAPRGRVQMIPNMTIHAESPPAAFDRSAATDCLYVGRLEPEKNLEGATGAFAVFAATHADAKLVIAGEGTQAGEIVRIAGSRQISDRVEMLGFRRDVPTLMSRARIFISLSHHEGMPNGVMEAIAADLPAVVSNIPEHRALLGDAYPFYVDVGASDEAAAQVISRAWADASRSPDTFDFARDVLATMTPKSVTEEYLRAFASVIEDGGSFIRRVVE